MRFKMVFRQKLNWQKSLDLQFGKGISYSYLETRNNCYYV